MLLAIKILIIFQIAFIHFDFVHSAVCDHFLPKNELMAQIKTGDILTLRRVGDGQNRTVIYLGNNRIVYGPENGKEFAIGIPEGLFGDGPIEGCVNNKYDAQIEPDSDSEAILKRALSQVGTIAVTDELDEQKLANYGRYGHHNRTWIEQMVEQSSLVLQGEIGKSSLKIKEAVDGIFGKFTQKLVDKFTGSLKSSSAKLGAGSIGNGGSIGNSLGMGTSFGGK